MRLILILLVALSFGGVAQAQDVTSKPTSPKKPMKNAPSIAIPQVKTPVPGILTGGQPTEAQLIEASKKGYTLIINLRGKTEDPGFDEKASVEKLGMKYLAIPISGAADLTKENMQTLVASLKEAPKGPVMIHCASGNRVGALLALKAAWVDGKKLEDAVALGKKAGLTRLEGAVRALLKGPKK